MLQLKYRALSLLALAIAAPGVALSEAGSLARFSAGESIGAPAPVDRVAVSQGLLTAIDGVRRETGVTGLELHQALTIVAQEHARDMARRQYAADVSPEGLTLLDHVRQTDRQTLYSAFGTAIVIVDAGASADAVLATLMSAPFNRDNMLRSSFDHIGIGAVEQDGRLYVVQLLARVEGQLRQPLPLNSSGAQSLRADLAARGMTPVSWSLSDDAGATLLRGTGERMRDPLGQGAEGYLNLDVAMGQDIYTLRGPYVRVN